METHINDTMIPSTSLNNCTICFTEISEQGKITLNCKHYFCNLCIQEWLNKGKNTCPLCRIEINDYKLNGENYRLILKQINSEENNTEINDLNRQLIKINGRIKCFFYLSTILLTYFANMYFKISNDYNQLNEEYFSCNTNLTNIINDYNDYNNKILHNVGIYSLDNHLFKSCSISQYFYNKCFMN